MVSSGGFSKLQEQNGNNQLAVKSTSNHADNSSSGKPITLVR